MQPGDWSLMTASLDFAVTRFLMKMFRTVNMDVINECRFYFDFMLPSELLVKRKSNFLRKFNSCSIIACHFGFAKCVKCVWQLLIFLLVKLIKFFLYHSLYCYKLWWIKIFKTPRRFIGDGIAYCMGPVNTNAVPISYSNFTVRHFLTNALYATASSITLSVGHRRLTYLTYGGFFLESLIIYFTAIILPVYVVTAWPTVIKALQDEADENKEHSYRWQTARRNCWNTMAWLTPSP